MYMNLQELKINDGLRKRTVFEKKSYGRISLLDDEGSYVSWRSQVEIKSSAAQF